MDSLKYDDLVRFCRELSNGLHLRYVDLDELKSLTDIFGSKRCQIDSPDKLAMVFAGKT